MKTRLILGSLLIVAASLFSWRLADRPTSSAPSSTTDLTQPMEPSKAVGPAGSLKSEIKVIEANPVHISTDAGKRCAGLLAGSSSAQRQLEFAKLLTSTSDEAGIRAILAVFRERYHAGKRDSAEWQLLWSELVGRDPRAAAALIDSYADDPKWQASGLAMVAHDWAKKDPQAAIAWLATHDGLTDNALDMATLNVMAGYAENDLSAATAYSMRVLEPGDKLWGDTSWVLTNTAMQKGGAKGLTDYFEALPEESKQRLFIATANRLGSVSIQTKMQWLAAQAGNAYRNDASYRETAETFAGEDPVAALKWVFSLPPSPKEGKIIGVGFASFPWMVKDLNGFIGHYRSLSPDYQQQIFTAVEEASRNPKMGGAKHDAAVQFLSSVGTPR
jgi:hypothetical protein